MEGRQSEIERGGEGEIWRGGREIEREREGEIWRGVMLESRATAAEHHICSKWSHQQTDRLEPTH